MKIHEIKILADENISPKVVKRLRELGYDIIDVKEKQWFGKEDEDVLNIAFQEKRFVLTHDSDFGTLAVNEEKNCYGVLYIRLNNLKHDNAIRVCEAVFQMDIEVIPGTIIVIEESKVRIRYLSNIQAS
jgi:predicted nuclease of predicted toxin-antitoxin system